ncbi:hypothetical protein FSARC_13486 [Fusarium sarcochroum]|uniref:Obg-like ATPase 1 n=1 Tax=Fusarium sarcochroum TaxID=1208366 RepID=A0A8H4WTH7_9HYPO|nr:hypothetical protein FSARC_13486 [Fusarium sarcochroum]
MMNGSAPVRDPGPSTALQPPYKKQHELASTVVYPCRFRHGTRYKNEWVDPQQDPAAFLAVDLKCPKLNTIHDHLWLAGIPRPARPLHQQKLCQRSVYLTESCDEHLVWHERSIFIKPCPSYLLNYETWLSHLCVDEELYTNACGLLLSYTWLVNRESDFLIAQDCGILSKDVEWPAWKRLVDDFLNSIDEMSLLHVNCRYHFGELRLARVSIVYRLHSFCRAKSLAGRIQALDSTYMPRSTWYKQFFEKNFGWIVTVFIYISVVLSSLQVGLGTERLQNNTGFHQLAVGVTLASLASVAFAMTVVILIWSVLVTYYLLANRQYWKQIMVSDKFIMPPKKVEVVKDNVVAFGRVRKNLKMGCVGLPNVGKSSLFNLLTEQSAAAENYPFCTIEPNEARCAVPDARYDFLCDLWKPPSMYPAFLQVTDIAGLIKGASQGEGLGNAFLSHIQAVDGMFHIVRAFDNDQVLHVDDSIDPVRDLDTIQSELCLKDLDILQKTIIAEEAIVKKAGGKYKMLPLFTETTTKIREMLENDKPVRDGSWTPAEIALINEKIQLITTKPAIYLVNLTMKDYLRQKSKYLPSIAKWVTEHGGLPRDIIPFSIEFEEKVHSLKDDPDAQAEFLKESKVKSKLDKIITEGFTKLGLQYYFTAGEKEIRCWTIPRGCLAPQAAGAIHSDFERGFIKAEVVAYQDFHDLCEGGKSMGPIKAAGKYRQEGKSYVVQDGDIVHFQFNVSNKK